MTNMNVSMTLSLVNTASPQVKAFMEQLGALESVVARLGGKLGILTTSIDAVGASMGVLKGGAATAAAEVGSLGAISGVTASHLGVLDATVNVLGTAITGLITKLTAATAGIIGMGGAAATAGVGGGGAMNIIGMNAANANGHVNALSSSIKGMAELWAAFKIEKGLGESVKDAAEYERTDNRLRNLKLKPEESDAIHGAVRKTGKEFPQFDQNALLEMAIDLRNATGSAHEAATGLKGFAESIFAINLSMPSGKKLDQQGQLNFAKFLEGRGVTMDPAAMEAQQDLVTKIVAATQGRVNPNNLFGNLTYAKGGLGRTMEDEALVTFAAMIEQDTRGGGTGGTVGTMLTSFVNSITKSRAITTKNRDEWLKLGLVDPEKVNINANTNHVTSIQAGAIAGTEIVGKNFKRWVDEYLRPALIAAGVNMSDLSAVKSKTDVLFPDRNAAETAFQLLSKKDLIEKDSANITGTAGKNEQVANGTKLAEAQFEKFKVAVKDLAIAIGTTLLPVITPLISGLASIIQGIAGFTTEHPIFGFFAAMVAGVASVVLAFMGFKSMFGILGSVTTALGFTSASFAPLAAAASTAASLVGVAARAILTFLGPVGLVISAILLAWQFGLGEWISKLNVFGHSVGEWATILSDSVVGAFESMWIRTKRFFGLISADAAAAQLRANKQGGASGDWGARRDTSDYWGVETGGASGDWEDAKPKTAEQTRIDAELAKNKAAAEELERRRKKNKDGNGGAENRFSTYDASLDAAQNAYRLEEDELKRHLKVEEQLYKASKISIADYYDDKLAQLRKSTAAEITELERQQAAYRKQGDKAGVNRVGTDIELKNRGLADAEKSVEVEREKDLNALKEKGLALDALILEAEGKRRQSQLARDVARGEKEKKEFLINGDQTNADRAQKVIDIAKLSASWEQFGDDTKKVQEDTRTREEAVSAAVKSGSLSSYQAEQQVFALRQDEAKQLDELIAKYRALIEASDAPQEVKDQKLRTLNLKQASASSTLGELNPELLRAKQTLDGTIEGGFSSFFNSVIGGSKSATSAFKDFTDSIKSSMVKLISEQLGKSLFQSLFGGSGVNVGGSGLLGMVGSLFGGGGGGVMSSGDYAAGDFLSFDVGTDRVPQDMLAMIHKDEIIVPAYDADRVRALKNGGGQSGAPSSVTMQIHPDAFHMKLGDWFEGEMSRQLANR